MVKIATIVGGPDNMMEGIQSMKALDRALAYFTLAAPHLDAFDVIKELRQSPPPVSRNSTRTKGRKFASQRSRANRRKAKR